MMTSKQIRRLGRLSPELREDFEERSAILEFEAGIPREEAEELALKMIEGKASL